MRLFQVLAETLRYYGAVLKELKKLKQVVKLRQNFVCSSEPKLLNEIIFIFALN